MSRQGAAARTHRKGGVGYFSCKNPPWYCKKLFPPRAGYGRLLASRRSDIQRRPRPGAEAPRPGPWAGRAAAPGPIGHHLPDNAEARTNATRSSATALGFSCCEGVDLLRIHHTTDLPRVVVL